MTELTLTEGDTVDVYDDPIDCTRLEGHAKLVELVKDHTEESGLQYWLVELTDDPGAQVLRAVNVKIY